MRISEILFWNDEPTEGDRPNPQPDLPPASCSDFLPNLSNAFTRRGLVKHFWNLSASEDLPSEPAPAHAETALIPSATSHPTTASWQAEPAEEEPSVGHRRLDPFRKYRGEPAG